MLRSIREAARPTADRLGSGLAARVREHLEAGDAQQACRVVEAAVRQQPTSAALRFQLAVLRRATGDRTGAAAEFTRVLRLAPQHREAAQRLGEVLAQGVLPPGPPLDATGLANCLMLRTVDLDLVGAAALSQLSQSGPLSRTLARCRVQGATSVASDLLTRRSPELIRDQLLLAVLKSAIVADEAVERLLTALRRALLLEVPRARLAEPDLLAFALALAALGKGNEYVFDVSPEERAHLDSGRVDAASTLAGDPIAGLELLARALYRDPVDELPRDVLLSSIQTINPAALGSFVCEILEERRAISAHISGLTDHGTILSPTSLRVADQYRTHPYPRWRGTAVFKPGKYAEYLETFFAAAQLEFARQPFEVLVAGCGTGCQAVSAALDYGSRAAVTAIDISAPSLGYAAMMADRLEAPNVSFALADIAHLGDIEPTWDGRFQVIECSGVLHHMADPFEAWSDLLDCLAPGGIMLVGLYSTIARRELDWLRAEPEYPGPGCDDHQLRAYRQLLLSRSAGQPGTRFMRSRDAHTTSGFRDFFLHVSEQATTLGEIGAFLDRHGLVFKGFVNAPFGALARRFPDEVWPGRLEHWAELEAEMPALFIGMYQFWITRA